MKLVIRIDDFGYTDLFNLAALETIDCGYATHVEVMLDCPGTVNALKLLRERPWLSVGWHSHTIGRSVLDPLSIPSFARTDGRFRVGNHNNEHGAKPLYDEVKREFRAELDRCIEVLGRAPDFCKCGNKDDDVTRAMRDLCEEYGIGINAFTDTDHSTGKPVAPHERFKNSTLFMPNQYASGCEPLNEEHIEDMEKYDVKSYFLDDPDKLLEKECVMIAFHPGCVDKFITENNSYLERFYRVASAKDISALTSEWLRKWLLDNNIELVSMRDAVYGTRDYQNHLRLHDSALYMG